MALRRAKEDHRVNLRRRGSDGGQSRREGEDGEPFYRLLSAQGRVHIHAAEILVQILDPL